jgi:hypothetical protein
MKNPSERKNWLREELLHLLSVSGTLAGLCVTGVALFRSNEKSSAAETIADDALAITALLFLICTYVIFFALRTKRPSIANILEGFVDVLFLLGLTGMVASGFIMVYTIW